MKESIDVQGHRGARGLRPENTVIAFIHALDLGVNTLEMDVTVTKAGEIIVSHEPYFNHHITTRDSIVITESNDKEFNFYEMSIEEIKRFDVGLKKVDRFPYQKKIAAVKPTLSEVVAAVNSWKNSTDTTREVSYNIEIKRKPDWDNIYHPEYTFYVDQVVNEMKRLNILNSSNLQSFDFETLQYIHEKYPTIPTALLIENLIPFERNISNLGYHPAIYSPHHKLVSHALISYADKHSIKVIPWTVNEVEDIENLLDMGVDGIISDYPDRVIEIIESKKQ